MNTGNLRFRSNRVRDILGLFHEELDTMYGSGEVGVFCEMLFEAFFGWDKVQLMTRREETVNQSDLLRFHWALEDLRQQRPIQHIIGYTDFCGCRIEVNPDVLIPRPETEELVEWVITTLNSQFSPEGRRPSVEPTLNFLDLCTGSGCIAIALKKAFPLADVTAVDISGQALEIARRNAEANSASIHLLQTDILNAPLSIFNFQFSIIISNPPYVRESERSAIQRNVLDYEPGLALFVPDSDPLLFYRAIAAFAQQRLQSDGLLVVEINGALADETCDILRDNGFNPTLHTDFRGNPRFLSATKMYFS